MFKTCYFKMSFFYTMKITFCRYSMFTFQTCFWGEILADIKLQAEIHSFLRGGQVKGHQAVCQSTWLSLQPVPNN